MQIQLPLVHILLFLAAMLMILITDACGLIYLIGWRKRMNKVCLRIKHGLIASMCAATIGTGILLVIGKPSVIAQATFWAKMAFVVALCINGWLIGRKIPLLSSGPFRALGRGARWSLVLGAIASLAFWIGAVIFGTMI